MSLLWHLLLVSSALFYRAAHATFDLYVDSKDFRKLLGVDSQLWYVRDGEVKENALIYAVLVPAHINVLTFHWRARHNIMMPYQLETHVGNPEAASAALNISSTGSVPTSLQPFTLTINCTGKLTTQVDVSLTLQLPLQSSLQHLTNITIHRRKICFRGTDSHADRGVVVSVVSVRGASAVVYITVGCLAIFLVVVAGLAAYSHTKGGKHGRRRDRTNSGSMQLHTSSTSPCLPNNSSQQSSSVAPPCVNQTGYLGHSYNLAPIGGGRGSQAGHNSQGGHATFAAGQLQQPNITGPGSQGSQASFGAPGGGRTIHLAHISGQGSQGSFAGRPVHLGPIDGFGQASQTSYVGGLGQGSLAGFSVPGKGSQRSHGTRSGLVSRGREPCLSGLVAGSHLGQNLTDGNVSGDGHKMPPLTGSSPLPALDNVPYTDSRQGDMTSKLASVLVNCDDDTTGSCVELAECVLEGTFGRLYRGMYSPKQQDSVQVMVKTVADVSSSSQREMLLRESVMLVGLHHSNILPVLAVLTPRDCPPRVLYRTTQHGNMKMFLQKCGPLVTREVVSMGLQALHALAFLHKARCLHNDVSARNCVVDGSLHVQLGDCALSRDLFPGDYHCLGDNNNRPIKWLALEALQHNSFSPHSDVWSWGVLLWEVMTLGQQPYAETDPFEMDTFLRRGMRLAQPINCPDEMFQAMAFCWASSPQERPTVEELIVYLSNFLQHLDRFV